MSRKNRRRTATMRPINEKEIIMGNTIVRKQGIVNDEDLKNEILDKFDWSSKSRSSKCSDNTKNVSITYLESTEKGKPAKLSFVFRNDVYKKINDTEFVQICAHKNRLYIRNTTNRIGYKLYKGSKTTVANRYTKISVSDVAMKAFEGDYEDLKYDDFLELYYVEKEN